ncbi:MAG: hypothetical protein FRX49_03724 [Trebouxia sp. A1-2]|nr:MAG: hypothetical protein FRX49_03724 [Trebouxia sp. A1-2]
MQSRVAVVPTASVSAETTRSATCVGPPVWRLCETTLEEAAQVCTVANNGSVVTSHDLEKQ